MSTKAERGIIDALRPILSSQRTQARAGKERFGDGINTIANALLGPSTGAFLGGMRSAGSSGLSKEDMRQLGQDGEAAVRARCIEVARDITATTNAWIEEGRDFEEVFGLPRLVLIASTESAHAKEMGFALAVQASGGTMEWVADAKACDGCKGLNGRKRKAGKPFALIDGVALYHPPAHPHCNCKVRRV